LLTVDVPTPVTSLPSMVPPDIRAVAVLCVTVADGEVPVIVMVKLWVALNSPSYTSGTDRSALNWPAGWSPRQLRDVEVPAVDRRPVGDLVEDALGLAR
jgi:hypothetical protein